MSAAVGNMVRSSEQCVEALIDEGVLDALVKSLRKHPTLEGKPILAIAAFCQYEDARCYLKALDAQKLVATYTDSPNERVKRYAKDVMDALR